MSFFSLKSLRGGLNNSDPAIMLAEDQCTVANNVEFNKSMLGERRRGTSGVTLSATMAGKDRCTFLFRHLPTVDDTASQLWVLGVTGTSSYRFEYKDTTWHNVTISDTVSLAAFDQYRWQAVSLHGKAFFAFNTDVDRLHVWDGTTFRRAGLAEPAVPTSADEGGGTFSNVRYYRQRYVEVSGSVVLRRSEPSDSITATPSGTGAGIRVTKSAAINEGETHWELEASLDNVNFYRIARTVVATTTFDDTTNANAGYAQTYTLSEDIGAYTVLGSARYLTVDADRMVWAGSYENDALASTVGWTPTAQVDGVGDDERQDITTDPTLSLDGYEGGSITGLSNTSGGSFFAFKFSHIYKVVRTGTRRAAYTVVVISKDRGALHGSVVSGVDQLGRPCTYFLDPSVGPCRYGAGGLEWCGSDIRESWTSVHLDAAKVVCSGLYDPVTRQVQWNIATGSSDTPNLGITLQTDAVRADENGTHRGWATWDGNRTTALAMCLYSSNIEAGTARNRILRPFIGLEGNGLVHLCDTGNTDNGTAYTARVVSKPYVLQTIMSRMGVMAGALLAKAVTGASVGLRITRDFGLEISNVISVLMTPSSAGETQVIKIVDDFKMSEATTVQFEFVDDNASATTRWELNQLALTQRTEGSN